MDGIDSGSGRRTRSGRQPDDMETGEQSSSRHSSSRHSSIVPSTSVSTNTSATHSVDSYSLRSGASLGDRSAIPLEPIPRSSVRTTPFPLVPIGGHDEERFQVADEAMHDFRCVIPYNELLDIQRARELRPLVKAAPSKVAGKGTHASVDFGTHEIVGVYEGKELRRKRLNSQWESYYRDRTGTDNENLMSPLYVVYSRDRNGIHYFKEPDTYVAWTQVRVHNHGEDIGLNGEWARNDCAFLNHSSEPNVVLFPVVNPDYLVRMSQNGTQFIREDGLNGNNILLAVITRCPVKKGDELFFDYGGNPKFAHHGKDIMRFPEMCTKPVGNRMHVLDKRRWLTLEQTIVAAEERDAHHSRAQQPLSNTASMESLHTSDSDDEYLPSESSVEGSEEEGVLSSGEEGSDSPLIAKVPLKHLTQETLDRFDFQFRKRPFPGTGKYRQRRTQTRSEPAMTTEQLEAYHTAQKAFDDIVKGVRRLQSISKNVRLQKFEQAVGQLKQAVSLESLLVDCWDEYAVYEFLEEHGALEGDVKYLAMPFSLLKARIRNPRQFPDVLDQFIITRFENGYTRGMLHAHFTIHGITPPARFGTYEWTDEVFSSYETSIDASKLRAKVDQEMAAAGPSAYRSKSKTLSKYLTVAKASKSMDADLKTYLNGYYCEKKRPIHDIRKQLDGRMTNPYSGSKEWQAEDVVTCLIDYELLDVENDEDLLRIPMGSVAAVVRDMDNGEQIRASYLRAMLAAGVGFAGLRSKGSSLVGIAKEQGATAEKKGVLACAASLLLRHYDPEELIHRRSLDELYTLVVGLSQKTIPVTKDTPKVDTLMKDLLFRLRCREPKSLEAYVDARRIIGKVADYKPLPASKHLKKEVPVRDPVLNSIAAKLREIDVEVPVEYQTETSKDRWMPENLKKVGSYKTGRDR